MEIRRIVSPEAAAAAGHLFGRVLRPEAARRFLADRRHHLLIAYQDGFPAGMIAGVELPHPDRGTEMFLSELTVHESCRRRGIGRALVSALAELARRIGCYGMWVVPDEDDAAAKATYHDAGGRPETDQFVLAWTFAD